ncbi:hypothetical protein Plhal304r1_c013g0050791 [Plasmopara halstedii]
MRRRNRLHATIPTNTVIESNCGSVGITDHIGYAPIRRAIEHTHVKGSTKCVNLGTDTPALDAVESADEFIQRTTPNDGIPEQLFFLAPLPTMEELMQFEEVTYDDFLHDIERDGIAEVV